MVEKGGEGGRAFLQKREGVDERGAVYVAVSHGGKHSFRVFFENVKKNYHTTFVFMYFLSLLRKNVGLFRTFPFKINVLACV